MDTNNVAVALGLGISGVVISALALLQTQKAIKLSKRAILQTEQANDLSKLALLQTEEAKNADHKARLIDRAASRLQAFEDISGSDNMALITKYKTDHGGKQGGYYEHFRESEQLDIEVARSKLAKFWKVTIQLFEQEALPDTFFDRGQWLRWGDRYRQLVEPLDVARYYRDGFFEENQLEYNEATNRPKQYRFLQQKWEDVKRSDEEVKCAVKLSVGIEQERRIRLQQTEPVR